MNNLEIIRKNRGISREKLASQLGMTRQNLFLIEKEGKSINNKFLKQICNILHCSINDLYDENFDVLNITKNKEDSDSLINIKFFEDILKIDFIDKENFDNFILNHKNYTLLNFDKKIFSKLNILSNFDKNSVIAFQMIGNYMQPYINDGNIVVVDLENKAIFENFIYLINENGILKIRRIKQPELMSTNFSLVSDNNKDVNYKVYNLDLNDLKKFIYGKVVAIIS